VRFRAHDEGAARPKQTSGSLGEGPGNPVPKRVSRFGAAKTDQRTRIQKEIGVPKSLDENPEWKT